jgi:hypothetical protein
MPALRVDPLLSYARRVGGDIKVVLVVGAADQSVGADVVLQFRDGEVIDSPLTVAPAGEGRTRVEALIPEDRLGDGTWRMRLVDPTGPERRNLQTRVLVRAGMPIALLPGRPPDTRLPEPEPRA